MLGDRLPQSLPPVMPSLKLKDIAQLAGVSVTTAGYVLGGHAKARRIHPDTAARVLAIAREHDFRPNAQAAALRSGSSRTVGLIVPDIENPSYARLAKLLEASARADRFQLLVGSTDDDPAREQALVATFRNRRCDGLIVASGMTDDDRIYRDAIARGLPVVALDRELDPAHFVSFVSEDQDASRQLTAALLASRPTSLVYLGARAELPISRWRAAGFADSVSTYGGQTSVVHADAFTREEGLRAMQAVLVRQPAAQAILTTSYMLLTGVLDALALAASDWQSQTRLATFGDAQLLDYLPVPVDSVAQQHDKLASGVWAALTRMIAGEAVAPGVRRVKRLLRRRWHA